MARPAPHKCAVACPCPPFPAPSSPLPSVSARNTSFLEFCRQTTPPHTSTSSLMLFLSLACPSPASSFNTLLCSPWRQGSQVSFWAASPNPPSPISSPSIFSVPGTHLQTCLLLSSTAVISVCPFPQTVMSLPCCDL